MKTFKQFMDEAVAPSLVRATARTTMQNAALRNAGRELPKSSTAPKTASFTKLYHGTTKPASQAIDKSGWRTDTNVTRQMQGSGVYTTPQKGAAQMYANQRSLTRGEKPAVRTFNLPTNKFNAVKANRQSKGTWTLNNGGNKFNVMQMSPKAANKYDVTNKPQSAINVKGPQKAELNQRVRSAFQRPANVQALKTQLGLKPKIGSNLPSNVTLGVNPKGGGNSAQDVTDDPNSKPIAVRSRNYTIGGGQGYGIAGIKLADSYDMFDYILEHLVAEGYADTNAEALVIMANMSEEWKQSIING